MRQYQNGKLLTDGRRNTLLSCIGRWRTASILCFVMSFTQPLKGAEIDVIRHRDPKIVPTIFVKGELVQGDALQFERTIKGLKRGLVVLSSPGGSVTEGLGIGAAVNTSGLATMTADVCASACALIWLSGVRRYYNEGARIGFHAAYRLENGKPVETGMGNAEIGAFLAHLGLNREAIRFITSSPPNGMRWLTADDASRLGINIIVGNSMIDPSGKQYAPAYEAKPPKPDRVREEMYNVASLFVELLTAQGCSKFYKINDKMAQDLKSKILDDAKNQYDDSFLGIIKERLSQRLSEQKQEGERRVCDQNKADFEKIGITSIYLR